MKMSQLEFNENLKRVDNIISLHRKIAEMSIGAKEERDDILRSIVVFLHSTIEELVRNLFIERLPSMECKTLDDIPFSAHQSSHRAKGILLGELLNEYKGKLTENIVLDSINSYVDVMNLNDTTQLVSQLEKVKIDIRPLSYIFDDLNSLMQRRHQIVHQMDRKDVLDPDRTQISEIDGNVVINWRNKVNELALFCLGK